jgi:hypothetical protein
MHFLEPAQAFITQETGELAGASRRYQKRIRDLDGLYLDRMALESIAAGDLDGIRERAKAAALAAEARARGATQ